MRKPKATVKSLREELKNLQTEYVVYKQKVRAHLFAVRPMMNRRALMDIEPANANGMINGLTIPELVMLVNLCEGTDEFIILETINNKKDLHIVAKKNQPRLPQELI